MVVGEAVCLASHQFLDEVCAGRSVLVDNIAVGKPLLAGGRFFVEGNGMVERWSRPTTAWRTR
jgi:hypothetical protein